MLEGAPAFLRLVGGAALLLDVMPHHVFAKVVVDDVAAVSLDEADAELGARQIEHGVFFEPGGRGGGVNFAVGELARGFVPGVG